MRFLLVVLTLIGVGVASAQATYTMSEPFYDELRIPVGRDVTPGWVQSAGPLAVAMNHLMSRGEKWAACMTDLEDFVGSKYGPYPVFVWQQFACRGMY